MSKADQLCGIHLWKTRAGGERASASCRAGDRVASSGDRVAIIEARSAWGVGAQEAAKMRARVALLRRGADGSVAHARGARLLAKHRHGAFEKRHVVMPGQRSPNTADEAARTELLDDDGRVREQMTSRNHTNHDVPPVVFHLCLTMNASRMPDASRRPSFRSRPLFALRWVDARRGGSAARLVGSRTDAARTNLSRRIIEKNRVIRR